MGGIETHVSLPKTLGLVAVELDVLGIEILVQGIQVHREPGGMLSVRTPHYRRPDGSWFPAVILPPELGRAIAEEVLALCG